MSKKKLEVREINKKEKQIIIEQTPAAWKRFFTKYGKLLFFILLILALTTIVASIIITVSNLSTSDKPEIKTVSIDTDLDITSADVTLDPSAPLTDETAKNAFTNNSIFKNSGEVILVKTIETGQYILKLYSDYTAIKIMKNINLVTRIDSVEGAQYGISESGVINTKAKTSDVSKTNTKNYPWGTVNYYSDGSAEIIDSQFDIYVRNAKDIKEKYISNNKVSYIKETKNVGKTKLNYYYDGTIEVIKNGKSYLIRNENDLNISNNDVNFKNNNEATIRETKKLKDGKTIDYYTDGGAIINDGSRKLSVRKSNSIFLKDNKIYEIVDNIYVSISKTENNGNVIYYTNGSAVIKNYNGKTLYIEENSDIKYKNDKISDIGNKHEELTENRNVDGDKISKFETVAVVETDKYIAIVPKDNILYDSDGSLKEILDNDFNIGEKPIKITNSTNETIQYRLVIEKSSRTTLDVQYIRCQLSVGNNYVGPKNLDSNIWTPDRISNHLSVTGTNYILLEKTLEPYVTDEIRLMLWTDYDTIPNSMQDKYFYGTLKIYAWQEIK